RTETDSPARAGAQTTSGPGAVERVEKAYEAFRELFPIATCYERIVPVDEVVTLTLFHREDSPLKRLFLSEDEVKELDQLWDELRFVSREPLKNVVAHEQISEFATQDRPDLVIAFKVLKEPLARKAAEFRERLVATEPTHLTSAIEFAARAWRRPLRAGEEEVLRALYATLRRTSIPHEESIRLLIARVLTSPQFLYRLESPPRETESAKVSPLELANRLSYFLWSSMPDDELRQFAESGRLRGDDALLSQTSRLLKHPRARRLAIHFACQWLHVRNFDQDSEKNERLYPEYASLRGAMYEETVRFFEDLFRNDGSILSLVDSDHSFLNESLARHYGLDSVKGDEWRRVSGLRALGRGGILGMATILASQSGTSRTSPILRGNWISETILGEKLPKPPPNVPQLPEIVPQGLTARELIEKHSSAPECAKCHARIDPYGFALEAFDTVGRARKGATDTKTRLIDGVEIDGLPGLRKYLLEERRSDFVEQFCQKLLGYALGRAVTLSDRPLLTKMQKKLEAGGYRFS
ncbi:MAG: DUF1592 domain-containing protein, partial [Planctomycetota bacterium]